MIIVTLTNDKIVTTIHGQTEKLKSGNVIQGINCIDSFSFAVLPSNRGYNSIKDRKTIVSVYNTRKHRYEFRGRVLYSEEIMDESGLISKSVTCESFLGFLCDSIQDYVEEKNWTVSALLEHIITIHNAKVEPEKHFVIGEVTVTDANDNLYLGIQRESTWETINNKLIKKLGGEIRFRVSDGITYLDYLTEIGGLKATKIELSRNMQKISKETDSTAFITRLEPYGCKLTKDETVTDDEGNTTTQTVTTEERLDISSVNNGLKYIVDEEAEKKYGIIVGVVTFDDVTDPDNLLRKGKAYLTANNKLQIKYTITALDLSLLGLDVDNFEVHNYYPIKNRLLGIDDTARIIKKNLNICDEHLSAFEVGKNYKKLSDYHHEQSSKVNELTQAIGQVANNYVTNKRLQQECTLLRNLINQISETITTNTASTYQTQKKAEEDYQLVNTKITTNEKKISILQSFIAAINKHMSFTGDGVAIGKAVELPNVFDIGFKTKFTGGIQNIVLDSITNLNDVVIPNIYVSSTKKAESYENCPITAGSFVLEVMSAGDEGQVLQRLTSTFKETHETWERHYYQSSWGAWVCVRQETGWLDLTLESGITVGTEYGYLAARLKDGVLYLKGDIKGVSADLQAIATLPSSLIVSGLGTNCIVGVYDMSYFCRFTLTAAGKLHVTCNGSNTWDTTKLISINAAICI